MEYHGRGNINGPPRSEAWLFSFILPGISLPLGEYVEPVFLVACTVEVRVVGHISQ